MRITLPISRHPRRRFTALALLFAAASTAALGAAAPVVVIVSGQYQSTPYASRFAAPLTVKVIDPATRAGLAGYQVAFTTGGGISLSALSVSTNAAGLASVVATGSAAGRHTVSAQIAGTAVKAVAFNGLDVAKVPLRIDPANVTALTGEVPAFNNYSLQGFVAGESAFTAEVTGAPILTTHATEASRDGVYAIYAHVGSLSAPNYSFVPARGTLTLAGVSECASGSPEASQRLMGTYAFQLHNQQGGSTGLFTADGVSKVEGSAWSNRIDSSAPVQSAFYGIFAVAQGGLGGIAMMQTEVGNPAPPQVAKMCLAIDHVVNGVATGGRLISAGTQGSAEAGSFYLEDGAVASPASLQGTYVLSLQGTGADTTSAMPVRSLLVAEIALDGNGNIAGGLADVESMRLAPGTPFVQGSAKTPVTGNYFYNPVQGTGVLALQYDNAQVNLEFVAPSAQHLLLMTLDGADTVPSGWTGTEPVYFGNAMLRSADSLNAATVQGNLNMRMTGLDPNAFTSSGQDGETQIGMLAETGGYFFDGAGTFLAQGLFGALDGEDANTQVYGETGNALPYSVDPVSGRFASLDPATGNCLVCGYIVGPNEIEAVAMRSGLPLLARFEPAAAAPGQIRPADLAGSYSFGSAALVSPSAAAWEGVLRCDGKGRFEIVAEVDGTSSSAVQPFTFAGRYAAADGAYAFTADGKTQPDFYLYWNANGSGSILPSGPAAAGQIPMLEIGVMNPSAN